jgi:7-cyano-7-deazaguanine synthase
MSNPNDCALVLFSGGQDSATCLAWALDNFAAVETIGFDYGQRHAVELECRRHVFRALRDAFPDWSSNLGEDHMIDLDVLNKIGDTALTREAEIKMGDDGLPNTFVPGRNLLFLTVAAALAYRREARHIVGGMCETDYSGYPDCRDDAVKAMQVALNLGMDRRFVLHMPLMWIDKAESWRMTERLGGAALIDIILEETHTCYLGERETRHDWGYGCGTCPACELRASGYARYTAQAPR